MTERIIYEWQRWGCYLTIWKVARELEKCLMLERQNEKGWQRTFRLDKKALNNEAWGGGSRWLDDPKALLDLLRADDVRRRENWLEQSARMDKAYARAERDVRGVIEATA